MMIEARGPGVLTPDDVEAALIEAMRVWDHGSHGLSVVSAGTEPGGLRVDDADGFEVRSVPVRARARGYELGVEPGQTITHNMAARRRFVTSQHDHATDGPWDQHRPLFSERHDANADGAARAVADAVRRPRPDRAMIGRATDAAGWLTMVDEGDRRLVILAIGQLARGRAAVPWGRLLKPMGLTRGEWGLRRRYARALKVISDGLNAAGKRGD